MKYVSVDIETTDLCPIKGDIVEFGAVIDDLEKPRPVESLPRFHAYVLPWRVDENFKHLNPAAQQRHARYHGDPFALSMHPTIFRRIAKREAGFDYLDREQLIRQFKTWLDANRVGDKTTLVGKNFASFDLQFLNRIPNWYLMENSYRTLDPAAWFLKATDKVPPSTRTCLERAGLDGTVAHTAVEDAIAVIRLVRHGMLVHEPADYSAIADEKPATVTLKPPAPYAHFPQKVSGCSVAMEIKDGIVRPKLVPTNQMGFTIQGEKK